MRREFEQYRAMGRRIELLKCQLEQMECLTDTVKGSCPEYPYTLQTMTVSGRNVAEEIVIRREIDSLAKRRADVRQIIREIKDEDLKLMLELKYTDSIKRSWDEVAEEMQETVSGEALRKRADKFFDELSENS